MTSRVEEDVFSLFVVEFYNVSLAPSRRGLKNFYAAFDGIATRAHIIAVTSGCQQPAKVTQS
jgi:hypothetical protein